MALNNFLFLFVALQFLKYKYKTVPNKGNTAIVKAQVILYIGSSLLPIKHNTAKIVITIEIIEYTTEFI